MSAERAPAAKRHRADDDAGDANDAAPPAPAAAAAASSPTRALEFYCGIGGLHYSLLRARPDASVVAAFDVNPHGNDVYEHNFGVRPLQRNLLSFPAERIDKFAASLWLMSPPCQPFTRQGHQRDVADGRSQSFLHILDEMPNLRTPPTHVLVENVVGFETSEMRDVMLETFRRLGFTTKERVLTPRMFGVPYSRPRYFCLAKRAPLRWVDGFDERDAERGPIRAPPPSRLSHPSRWVPESHVDDLRPVDPTEATTPRLRRREGESAEDAAKAAKAAAAAEKAADPTRETKTYGVARLEAFMETDGEYEGGVAGRNGVASNEVTSNEVASNGVASNRAKNLWRSYAVSRADIEKGLASIDAVTASDRKCNCFTKSYGKYVKGTGSFVANRAVVKGEWDGRVANARENEQVSHSPDSPEAPSGVSLRYFTEREVANIHSFPPEFGFPESVTRAQRYALLGNSLSVACVAPLVDYLLNDA